MSFGLKLVSGMGLGMCGRTRRRLAGGLMMVALLAGTWSAAGAQSQHRTRRESSANRKARIARTVEETYSHRWEVGGGGGYLRFQSGPYLQQNNEVTFWSSALYTLNPKLGVVVEGRGGFGRAKVGNTIYNLFNPAISEFNMMAGPSYRFVAKEKYTVSGFAEGGAAYGKFAGDTLGLPSQNLGIWEQGYAASASAGVNLDYNVYPNLALRVSPSYLFTTYGGSFQHNKGVNVGVVYRFGRR